MKYTIAIDGHTIDVCQNGTSTIDPWSEQFAFELELSIMCTADMAIFMLVDKDRLYLIERTDDALELYELHETNALAKWEAFQKWFEEKLNKRRVRYCGTIRESIDGLIESKKRDEVWETIPKEKRHEVYEFLKTLTKAEKQAWYERKYEELGIVAVERPDVDRLRSRI